MNASEQRLHFFDNLKSAVILLIVAFHCAMSFMKYVPDWWYVINNDTALPFTWFVIWADNFIMPIMFFISGYFGLQSLRRWQPAKFWRLKFHRIGLPWMIGMIFFVPYLIWLWFFSRDIEISFYDLIIKQYFGVFYQQGVYWYLSALMALYFLLFCILKKAPFLFKFKPINQNPAYIFLIYVVATTIPMFLINLYYPDSMWINCCYVLMLQITRVPIYIVSFILGAYCENNKLIAYKNSICRKYSKLCIVIFVFSSLIFIYFRITYRIENYLDMLLNAFIHCAFCGISLVTAIFVFKSYFDFTNKWLTLLSRISYIIYFIHQNIGQSIILYVRQYNLGIFAKYAISLLICIIICLFLSNVIHAMLASVNLKPKKL